MPSNSFDATARIDVDLRGFSTATSQVLKAGGQMEQTFRQLHAVLGNMEPVEKAAAKEMTRSLRIYQQAANAAKSLAGAIKAMAENEEKGASASQHMSKAMDGLKSNLAQIRGLSEREAERIGRTVALYERMANVMKRLAEAQTAMMSVTQKAEQAEQRKAKADQDAALHAEKLARARNETKASTERLTTAENNAKASAERLKTAEENSKTATERLAAAKTNAKTAEERLNTARTNSMSALARQSTAENNAASSAARLTVAQNNALTSTQRLAQGYLNTSTAAAREAAAQSNAAAAAARATLAQERLTQAQRQSAQATASHTQSAFQMRSALGEIESQGQALIRTLVNMTSAVLSVGIAHEASFAQVRRVLDLTDKEAHELSAAFQQIAVEFPISREEVDRIGQLAGQLGIATTEMDAFVRTVAQFSITTGISSEQVTLFLGRIKELQNIPSDQVNNLASTILRLGTVSAATEEQILKVEDSISTVSNVFGLTAQATTALSAAFATLNIKPELARGTLTRVFGQLEKAINGSGKELETLSTLMGLTSEEMIKLRNTNPDEFLFRFVEGLGQANAGGHSFRETLSSLGINAVRDIDAFSRLGNNVGLLRDFMDKANIAWRQNDELQRQSQTIFKTTQAELGNMKDAFGGLLAVIGEPLVKGLGDFAHAAANLIQNLIQLDNRFGGLISTIAAGGLALGAGVAAWLAYKVAMAKVIQTIVAVREVQAGLGVSTLSLRGAFDAWANSTRTLSTASAAQAAATQTATAATAAQTAAVDANLAALRAETVAADAAAMAQRAQATATTMTARAQAAAAASTTAATTSTNLQTNAERARALAARLSVQATEAQAAATAASAQSQAAATSYVQAATVAQNAQAASAATATVATRAFTLAARGVSAALGPIGLLITAVSIGMLAYSGSAEQAADHNKEMAESAWNAVGGLSGLRDALNKDTQAWNDGVAPLRTYSVTSAEMSRKIKESREQQEAMVAALEKSTVSMYGSEAALRQQAEVQGQAGDAARVLVSQLDASRRELDRQAAAVQGNTIAFGKNAAAKVQAALQESLYQSALKSSDGAMSAFVKTGTDMTRIMDQISKGDLDDAMLSISAGLNKAETSFKNLDRQAKEAATTLLTMKAEQKEGGDVTNSQIEAQGRLAKSLRDQANDAKGAVEVFKNLQDTLKSGQGEMRATATTQEILGGSAAAAAKKEEDLAQSMDEASEKAGAAKEVVDALSGALEGIGGPATAWKNAMSAADGASEKTAESTKKVSVSIRDLMKAMEEAVAAQRDYATNLVTVMSRVPADVAAELAKMGPESAQLIKLLTTMSKPELDKYVAEFRATGEGARNALGRVLQESAPILASVGGAAGAAISKALGDSMNASIAKGGNVEAAVTQIGNAIKVLSLLRANPQVDLNKLPFEQGLAAAIAKAYEITTGHKLDAEGMAKLASGDYTAVLADLEAKAKNAEVDVNGNADLNAQQWDAKAKELERRAREGTLGNAWGVSGRASMETGAYYASLSGMSNTSQSWSSRGFFSPYGKASVDTGAFYASLNGMTSASYNTGRTIQANLTKTAYITYYYQAGNSPPNPRNMYVKDGGWIRGPGGPRDDKVPAMLSNGEFVVNAASARQYASLLESINNGGKSGSVYSTETVGGAWSAAPASPKAMAGVQAPSGMTGGGEGGWNGPRTVINVHNTYPREEPTSVTINRSLAYAATLSGV